MSEDNLVDLEFEISEELHSQLTRYANEYGVTIDYIIAAMLRYAKDHYTTEELVAMVKEYWDRKENS